MDTITYCHICSEMRFIYTDRRFFHLLIKGLCSYLIICASRLTVGMSLLSFPRGVCVCVLNPCGYTTLVGTTRLLRMSCVTSQRPVLQRHRSLSSSAWRHQPGMCALHACVHTTIVRSDVVVRPYWHQSFLQTRPEKGRFQVNAVVYKQVVQCVSKLFVPWTHLHWSGHLAKIKLRLNMAFVPHRLLSCVPLAVLVLCSDMQCKIQV